VNRELAQWFYSEVAEKMAFLVDEYSFAPPVLQIDDTIHFAFVVYIGKNLAIEFLLDQRDEHFECRVSRVENDEVRDDYDWNFRDKEGLLVSQSVFMLLNSRTGGAELFHKPGGLPFKEKISIWLVDYERMLRTWGEDILEDRPGVLDE
jgi:hypothetical protein